jgi:hypothetical protein
LAVAEAINDRLVGKPVQVYSNQKLSLSELLMEARAARLEIEGGAPELPGDVEVVGEEDGIPGEVVRILDAAEREG